MYSRSEKGQEVVALFRQNTLCYVFILKYSALRSWKYC